MSRWLYEIWNLSLAAFLTLAVVLVVRVLLRKAPKKYSCFLWLAVFGRAVLPKAFSSSLSPFRLFPFLQTQNGQMRVALAAYQEQRLLLLLEPAGRVSAEAMQAGMTADGSAAAQTAAGGLGPGSILVFLWAAGVVLFLGYGVISWLRLHRQVSLAVKAEDGVYESDRIPTAFVLGFFRPNIYLPLHLEESERKLVLAHEQAHLRRFDPQWKLLAWLITVLHWFNPCMWIAFVLLIRDMEMACDERVLEQLGEQEKKEYGNCLLALASPRRFPAGSPLAFGESSIKVRIRNILRYRRGSLLAGMVALGMVLITLAACMSNPETEPTEENAAALDEAVSVIGGADGPTSIFMAGKLGTEASGEENEEELQEAFGENYPAVQFVSEWAKAVANRDADAVYAMLSSELQNQAEELGIETAENGQRVMGWSSPFVPEKIAPIIVLGTAGNEITAGITYPAMTSDPLWWVWKDEIIIEAKGDSWQVVQWENQDYFTIDSLEKFQEAYAGWFPDYQLAVVDEESFADYLQMNYEKETYPEYYEAYLLPERAAENTLHLSGGTASVVNGKDGKAVVSYTWKDGTVTLDMVQPAAKGNKGIWVPEGWSIVMQ